MANEWVRMKSSYYPDWYSDEKIIPVPVNKAPTAGSSATMDIALDEIYSDHFDSEEHPNGCQIFVSNSFITKSDPSTVTAEVHFDYSGSRTGSKFGYGGIGQGGWRFEIRWHTDSSGRMVYIITLVGNPLSSKLADAFSTARGLHVDIDLYSGGTRIATHEITLYKSSSYPYRVDAFEQNGETYSVSYSGYVTRWESGLRYGRYYNSKWSQITDNLVKDGIPYFKDENTQHWHKAWSANLESYLDVTYRSSTTVSVPSSSLEAHLYYYQYDGTDDGYTAIDLGSRYVGSEYTIPSNVNAGTKEHWTFRAWTYNGTEYSEGTTIRSYPFQEVIYSEWSGKFYDVNFSVTRSDASPQQIATKTVQYPNEVSIPAITAQHAKFLGWCEPGSPEVYYNNSYKPEGNITLISGFEVNRYTVKFYGYDETLIKSERVEYGSSVNVPPNSLNQAFTYLGWAYKGAKTIIVSKDATSYTPDSDVELITVYRYKLTAFHITNSTIRWLRVIYDDYLIPNLKINLPSDVPVISGYRFVGLSKIRHDPDPKVNNQATSFQNVLSVDSSVDFNALYAEYASVVLDSLLLDSSSFSIRVDSNKTMSGRDITMSPSSWLGDVYWEIGYEGTSITLPYVNSQGITVREFIRPQFRFVIDSSDTTNRTVSIHALASTVNLPIPYTISVKGRKEEWNPNSEWVRSQINIINLSQLIGVQFFSIRADPSIAYSPDMDYHTGNVWYVDDSSGEYRWALAQSPPPGAVVPPGAIFPPNPERQGYTFAGWVDNSGNRITFDTPPHYPTFCFATWTKAYQPKDRDILIFQRFNKDGNALVEQYDMGTITSCTERCTPSMTETSTPTMSSDNTFILDMGVATEVSIDIRRKNPPNPNNSSDDPREWTNGKWLTHIRGLVDRWQSETDGIKILYIPRGFRMKTILPGTRFERTFGYGDNYAMMGYVKPNTDNLGLLYGAYKLVGYNGVISQFTDRLSPESNEVITITLGITLGGMTSNYEDYIPIIGA